MKPRALLQAACLAGSARAALWARGYNNNTTATNINNSYSNSNTMGGGRSVNATAPVHVNNTAATTANDNNTTPDKSGVEDIGSGSSSSSSSSSTDDLSSAVGVTATLGGYTIPRDLPDGHYTIALHPNGTALHTRRWHAPSRRWHTLHRRAGGTGEYSFLVDDAHLRLEAVSQDSHAQQRVPLPADKLQCHCLHQRAYSPLNYPLPPQDYYASKQELFNWCNTFGWQGHHVSMALGGSVAVYVCGRKHTHHVNGVCSEAEYLAAEGILNQTCGDAAGYVFIDEWNKEYGRMFRGETICRLWQDGPDQLIPVKTVFDDPDGRGSLTSEPKGDRPDESAKDLYDKTVFEPLESKFGNEGDDDERQDFRGTYSQYSPGWGEGWKTLPPPNEEEWREDSH